MSRYGNEITNEVTQVWLRKRGFFYSYAVPGEFWWNHRVGDYHHYTLEELKKRWRKEIDKDE